MESIAPNVVIGFPSRAGASSPFAQLLEKAGRAILAFAARHEAARRSRATVDQLGSLNARQLADIGLTRADVEMMTNAVPQEWIDQRDRALFL